MQKAREEAASIKENKAPNSNHANHRNLELLGDKKRKRDDFEEAKTLLKKEEEKKKIETIFNKNPFSKLPTSLEQPSSSAFVSNNSELEMFPNREPSAMKC